MAIGNAVLGSSMMVFRDSSSGTSVPRLVMRLKWNKLVMMLEMKHPSVNIKSLSIPPTARWCKENISQAV